MKKSKLILPLLAVSAIAAPVVLITSCKNETTNTYQSRNSSFVGDEYDFGLATAPLNSLNYIKYQSVAKILPSLVEAPLKNGPNEALKSIYRLPEIQMGIYGGDEDSSTIDQFILNHPNQLTESTGRFYPLDQFGSTTGSITVDRTKVQQVAAINTKGNKILSMSIALNDGLSKWSNGDDVIGDDYIDALHYMIDFNTGSQHQTNLLQKKIKAVSKMIEAQQNYIKKFKKAYQNPFAYPNLVDNGKGIMEYEVVEPTPEDLKKGQFSSLWKSQSQGDEKEVDAIRQAALEFGIYSGRLYYNYSNKEILSSIPFSPDFNFNDEVTEIMLPNPEYDLALHSAEELRNIPKRIAKKIRKFTYTDPKQVWKIEELLSQSRELKIRLDQEFNNRKNDPQYMALDKNMRLSLLNKAEFNPHLIAKDFDDKSYAQRIVFARSEFGIRVEYDSYEPTSLNNAYKDLLETIIPVNRKFIESIGGINNFGLDSKSFLTNGPFTIDQLVLGPQGYITLKKDFRYYSSDRTISNKIRIFFSQDQNINSAMYDDGYIAATKIPAIQQLSYWANLNYRKNMNKSSGFGTIAFAFNLDNQTNSKSYLNNNDLRNAIYYALNRNDLLKIVGWNTSYPVNTWTAFGQGSSSFGDPVELGFDHDNMLTKVDANHAIPIQNYSHIDHLSKNYKFEHVDRTDLTYNLDIAKKYLTLFKNANPNLKKITLKFIHNSTDEQQNAGIGLKDALNKAFNGFIDIEIKGLPENVYEDARTKGQFDIIYKNFDTYGTDTYSYVRVFLKPDEINSEQQKNTGFRNNPAGSWTYKKYFSALGIEIDKDKIKSTNKALEEETRTRLRIEKNIWDKIVELSFQKENESLNEYTERYSSFFSAQFTDKEKEQEFTEKGIVAIISAFEKIVRDGAPVIPLMEVDTYWEISRVGGVSSLYSYSLQYAYDVNKPPLKNLPQKIEF
ncbi:ABC transporter substrate-binding protein [Mycoplasma crocodyli]|uniref:Oligopeptide ABC transporter, substrate-binding component OppA n=1 Tax=Mycoplasma crocodyli (strain ATCC 51981 / MP145) TaxID=512564 RepID=D5E5D8_MYCCM|nr:ABC transporter substrate-binding protein [Mycoplasma crocodyli]ADE19789.1 oligopeptide ABC transporter, substrate-binding component OppA [Mycoplasma crocodyli MP145]